MVPGEAGPFVQVRHGEPDIGAREMRILRHRLLEAATCLTDRREIGAFQGAPAAQPEIVGHQIVRPCAPGRLEARIFDAADQHRDDAARHLVLDVEELAHRAVVALRPELTGGVGLDQPHGDPDAPARPPAGCHRARTPCRARPRRDPAARRHRGRRRPSSARSRRARETGRARSRCPPPCRRRDGRSHRRRPPGEAQHGDRRPARQLGPAPAPLPRRAAQHRRALGQVVGLAQ